jgi:hypothetical protein
MINENSFDSVLSDHVARSTIFVTAAAYDFLDKHAAQSPANEAHCCRLLSSFRMV